MTQAGDLREVVDFQKRGDLVDDYGVVQPGIGPWEDVFSAPARIRILKGGETVIAGRLSGTQTAVVTIRHQPDVTSITTAWRIKDGRSGTIWNIRAITPDERRAWVDLLCESGVP